MITERPNAEYDCTMGQLYVIARSGWKSHMNHLTEFSGFSTLYTLPFATAALAEIDAAAAMPMFQERNEPTEETYTLMKNAANLAVKRWKYLRNYIRKSYAKELRKGKWESAGLDHYEKASNHNWSELLLMMTAGANFITANAATLSVGGMPGTFAADYAAARSGFAVLHDDFIGLEQGEKEGTDEKVIANNAVYRKMMDMFEDGQLLFEELGATRDRFIFQRIKETAPCPVNIALPPRTFPHLCKQKAPDRSGRGLCLSMSVRSLLAHNGRTQNFDWSFSWTMLILASCSEAAWPQSQLLLPKAALRTHPAALR